LGKQQTNEKQEGNGGKRKAREDLSCSAITAGAALVFP